MRVFKQFDIEHQGKISFENPVSRELVRCSHPPDHRLLDLSTHACGTRLCLCSAMECAGRPRGGSHARAHAFTAEQANMTDGRSWR